MPDSDRKPPVVVEAAFTPDNPSESAAFIFLHGLGGEGEELISIPKQFQAANKLPHLQWILPNALENRDAMQPAWYTPSPLSPYPPSRPELEEEEDEQGMKSAISYLVSLIDDLVAQGIPPKRIVLGGFSQGCAMTLLTGLTSKYAGQLAGLVGLSGYLPLADHISRLREEAGLSERIDDGVELFLTRGTKDMLVPKRHFRRAYETLEGLGGRKENMEIKEYEGMGHVMGGAELRDLCSWLERVVPPIDCS